jgi:hypothetical protein
VAGVEKEDGDAAAVAVDPDVGLVAAAAAAADDAAGESLATAGRSRLP